jgi:hypothetical protein
MIALARKINPGDRVQVGTGDIIKVLVSKPEPLSSVSASASQWLMAGYEEGKPTRTIVCSPELEFEIVERSPDHVGRGIWTVKSRGRSQAAPK